MSFMDEHEDEAVLRLVEDELREFGPTAFDLLSPYVDAVRDKRILPVLPTDGTNRRRAEIIHLSDTMSTIMSVLREQVVEPLTEARMVWRPAPGDVTVRQMELSDENGDSIFPALLGYATGGCEDPYRPGYRELTSVTITTVILTVTKRAGAKIEDFMEVVRRDVAEQIGSDPFVEEVKGEGVFGLKVGNIGEMNEDFVRRVMSEALNSATRHATENTITVGGVYSTTVYVNEDGTDGVMTNGYEFMRRGFEWELAKDHDSGNATAAFTLSETAARSALLVSRIMEPHVPDIKIDLSEFYYKLSEFYYKESP